MLTVPEDTSTQTGPDTLSVSHGPAAPGRAPGDQVRRAAHAVPTGSRVLHIGAPKTGTTAVQAAVDAVAETARRHGVSVAGTPNEQAKAALALLGRRVGWSQDPESVRPGPWLRMTERIASTEGTVFFSSEYLCEAAPGEIARVKDDLGAVHAVLTLRPLERVLPSAWQQYLKSGHRRTYQHWLEAMLAERPEDGVTPSFWRRHDQAAVAERWARVVGPGNLTVVVLPPGDRTAVFTAFDGLLGLPPGTLASAPQPRSNRSMTAAEAELFRRVNVTLRDVRFSWVDYAQLIRYGAILRTVERPPTPGAPAIETPGWALARAREKGAAFAERIGALGVHVIGDLDDLYRGTAEADPGRRPPATVEVEVAAQAVLGAVARASTGATYFDGEAARTAGLPGDVTDSVLFTPAGRLTSRQLAGLLGRRLWEGARRRLRR